jgi:hypothetical protein
MKFAIIQNNIIKRVIIADNMDAAISSCTTLDEFKDSEFDIVESEEEVFEGCIIENNNIIMPSPYPSWILIDNTWVPPIGVPNDDTRSWFWDEESISWKDMGPVQPIEEF